MEKGISLPVLTEAQKNTGPALARAPTKIETLAKNEPAIRRVVRASARLADLITDKDVKDSMRVVREAKGANQKHYDNATKDFVEYPDHKTRLAAVTLERAYDEGTPVNRIAAVIHHHQSAEEVIDRFRESPEMMQALKAFSGMGLQLEMDGQVLDGCVQETGSENESVAPIAASDDPAVS